MDGMSGEADVLVATSPHASAMLISAVEREDTMQIDPKVLD